MKIVFAASEAAPFLKTGGLGDVAEALPKALSEQKGNEVCVFLPYYKKIKENPDIKTEFVKSFAVNLAWRAQHVGVFKLKSLKRKLKIYFIDNEYYFGGRDSVYGDGDDGERFAYFSKAILESLVELNLRPDVIHCNDWQTALIPNFLNAFYNEALGDVKTVFTIHNIEYQGKADPYFICDTLGLPEEYTNTMLFDGCVNFMKGAILSCNALTTVSRTYADEIKYPYFAHGLSDVIKEHEFKLSGIVNGINTETNNPAADKALFANYNVQSFKKGKSENKRAIQEKLGLPQRDDVAVIGMVTRLVSHKGLDLVCAVIDELLNWDIQLVIIGTGDSVYENRLSAAAKRHPDKFSMNLCFDSKFASQVYAASDIYLMPSKSEPCGLSQLIAMRYGTIPVVNATGGLRDTVVPYNRESGEGVGFTFQSFNCDDMLAALRRALEIYGGDKKAWETVVTNAMNRDSSWNQSAKEYTQLYKELLAK
ncbi:MAG: glycogen synthase GlgA [Oscillospiraceae bacterium]|nr:glycogen synthase GlgA [Oscillospiraceae bacterium]